MAISIASVAIEGASPRYDRLYDYEIPIGMAVMPGCRVSVEFGASNRSRVAMVLQLREEKPETGLKPIQRVIDPEPLLGSEGLWLLNMLRETTFASWYDCVRVLIPPGAGIKLSKGIRPVKGLDAGKLSHDAGLVYSYLLSCRGSVSEKKAIDAAGLTSESRAVSELLEKGYATAAQIIDRRIVDQRKAMVRLVPDIPHPKLTPKAKQVVEMLRGTESSSVREVCYFTGVTKGVVERLRKKGIVEIYEEIVARDVGEGASIPKAQPVSLTEKQLRALNALRGTADSESFEISLLYGVTGSGKTQVLMNLIEHVLSKGKTAMVLIPEISLTPQTTQLFGGRFGSRMAVLHSSLSMAERLDEWTRIRQGRADLVIGTRSCVFAPIENIGLIVVDEEQEHTYHSLSSPRYHARDIAVLRAKRNNAQLVLCSATPSVESYHAAKTGKYRLVTLDERYTGINLPEVVMVDMRSAKPAEGAGGISDYMAREIDKNLRNREQTVLLLNRRGYFTLMKCSSCRKAACCPHCSIPLAYHSANRKMVCHYCGYTSPEFKICPSCASPMLRYTGMGTQRAAEELAQLFPDARILRMDADTTQSRFSHKKGFEAFAAGEYDIMLGTQMVTKGLDFPMVTLVGVLSADQLLFTEDFRGFERAFSMITQVVGRAGRAELPGRAVIQTWSPENRIFEFAASQDYDAFFQEEIEFRRVGLYPPFCFLAGMLFVGVDAGETGRCAGQFLAEFERMAGSDYKSLPLRILGPTEAYPFRAAGKYRWQIIVKYRADRMTYQLFRSLWNWYHEKTRKAALHIDMYYDAGL